MVMVDYKNKTACFTGHRDIPSSQVPLIKQKLKTILKQLICQGYCYFGVGGALGFDTLAAQIVIELKKQYSQIKLILVLPCKDQASRWNSQDMEEYERIKACADKIVYTSEHYYNGCMQKRNRHLVDYSSLCICYLTKQSGGTQYTVDYAGAKGLTIINLA